MDSVDQKIIEILSRDSRTPFTEIAKELGLSDVAIKKRVEKLIETGVIERFSIELNKEAMGLPVRAYILLRCSPENVDSIIKALSKKVKVERTLGSYDVIITTDMADVSSLRKFVEEDLGSVPGIVEIRTLIRV